MNTHSLSRRRLVAGASTLLTAGAFAGCTGDEAESDDETNDSPANGETEEETGDETVSDDDTEGGVDDGTETPSTDELDLREANVVGVMVEHQGEGGYQFDVTLHHDDDGEEGYANWWQVEELDGRQLGRRELLHAHSQQPFTRSETIDVPAETGCVVVRGHDQTHGYGGAAMVVDVESGATSQISQGSEPAAADRGDCP